MFFKSQRDTKWFALSIVISEFYPSWISPLEPRFIPHFIQYSSYSLSLWKSKALVLFSSKYSQCVGVTIKVHHWCFYNAQCQHIGQMKMRCQNKIHCLRISIIIYIPPWTLLSKVIYDLYFIEENLSELFIATQPLKSTEDLIQLCLSLHCCLFPIFPLPSALVPLQMAASTRTSVDLS
jgi:hypothetical protein